MLVPLTSPNQVATPSFSLTCSTSNSASFGSDSYWYFDGLNPRQRIEFSYKLRAKFPVRAKTIASRVYEYYNPTVEDKTKPVEMTVVAK